jgi:thermitase
MSRLSRLLLCVGTLLAVATTSAVADNPHVRGRVLVKFREGTSDAAKGRAMADARAQREGEIAGCGVTMLRVNGGDEGFVARILRERAEVEFAELDETHAPATDPNDPGFASWQGHLQRINCPAAWDLTQGSSSVIIAVLDTGVRGSHPDLGAKMVPGWNMVYNNSNTDDTYGHGTMVAGTAAAATNNGVGVAGVAWNCRIMPIKITPDGSTSASTSTIAAGLDWARQHGARVANVSFRASGSNTVAAAASSFVQAGGVVTVAAGNDRVYYSTADVPSIITVSGIDTTDACISDYGNLIDLAAPWTTFSTNLDSYAAGGGTSFSSPMVAGVAALVISANPTLSGQGVMDVLYRSADDIGTGGWDQYTGWGRVNARRAVELAMGSGPAPDSTPPSVAFTSPGSGSTVSGVVGVSVAATDNVGVSAVTLLIDGEVLGTDVSSPYSLSWDTSTVSPGTYTLAATALDGAGNYSTATTLVTVGTVAPDTQPPSVTITSPAAGQQITTNNVTVSIAATDNVGVIRAELYADGVLVGTSTTPPFQMRWATRRLSRGTHVLVAKAYDGRDNCGVSPEVAVVK